MGKGVSMAKYDSTSLRTWQSSDTAEREKTSLCEAFLFTAGKPTGPGRVDDGSSGMDYEPEEQKRRISISAAVNFFDWDKHKINIIDTPGDSNFAFDTKSCLRIIDSVIVVIDAVSGVEFQTQKVWNMLMNSNCPESSISIAWTVKRADSSRPSGSVKEKNWQEGHPHFPPHRERRWFQRDCRSF